MRYKYRNSSDRPNAARKIPLNTTVMITTIAAKPAIVTFGINAFCSGQRIASAIAMTARYLKESLK